MSKADLSEATKLSNVRSIEAPEPPVPGRMGSGEPMDNEQRIDRLEKAVIHLQRTVVEFQQLLLAQQQRINDNAMAAALSGDRR